MLWGWGSNASVHSFLGIIIRNLLLLLFYMPKIYSQIFICTVFNNGHTYPCQHWSAFIWDFMFSSLQAKDTKYTLFLTLRWLMACSYIKITAAQYIGCRELLPFVHVIFLSTQKNGCKIQLCIIVQKHWWTGWLLTVGKHDILLWTRTLVIYKMFGRGNLTGCHWTCLHPTEQRSGKFDLQIGHWLRVHKEQVDSVP